MARLLAPCALAAALALFSGPLRAQASGVSAASPSPLDAETSEVATLPPLTPHRVWLTEIYSGQTQIVDGDTGNLLSSVYGASLSDYASPPGQTKVYVAESIWSKGNRGERQNLLTVYDGRTLKLEREIPLPGRIYMSHYTHNFVLNAAGTRGYVFSMQPATSIVSVDLVAGKVERQVDIPGCAQAWAFGADSFASLCGDGSLAVVPHVGSSAELVRGKPFFDPERDPVFDESPSDPATGETLFISYSGKVFPVRLGLKPAFAPTWSLQGSAGMPPASASTGLLAWRPGGRVPFAVHRASGRLYALMHAGEQWSHKQPGTELWVVDTARHQVLRRKTLESPASALAVSQDEHPLLYLVDAKNTLSIRDALTLEEKRKIEDVRDVTPYVPPEAAR